MRLVLVITAALALSGCFGRSEPVAVEPTIQDAIAAAIGEATGEPVPVAEPEKKQLFGFLRRKPEIIETSETSADISLLVADLEGAADPEPRRGLAALFAPKPQTLMEPTINDDGTVQALPEAELPERKGLFAFLKPKPEPSILPTETVELIDDAMSDLEAEGAEVSETNIVVAAIEPPERRGFLSRLLKPKQSELAAPVTLAALPDGGAVEVLPQAEEPTTGLFGGAKPNRRSTVAKGETVSYGIVGVACDVPRRQLGKAVDQYPKEGRAVWRLHDTDPKSTGPRTMFITGFKDGCARQITGALALFGSPNLHETHRYGPAQKGEPYSDPDKAYEKIKSPICGVRRGKPCPEERAGPLNRGTSFVTVYPRFGGYPSRFEILLHKGNMIVSEVLR